MPAIAKPKVKETDVVIADATDRLLLEIRRKMLLEDGGIDYGRLAREGFSAAVIKRLKAL